MVVSRSQRRIATLRRHAALRRYGTLHKCTACLGSYRLGYYGDDHKHWYCQPCWDRWNNSESDCETKKLIRCITCKRKCDFGWMGETGWNCIQCWITFFKDHEDLERNSPQTCQYCYEVGYGWLGDANAWYCYRCWQQWFAVPDPKTKSCSAHRQDADLSKSPQKQRRLGEHFDFVEIGTSNYNTFTQACAGSYASKPGAWQFLPGDKSRTCIRGLAVDMKRSYLKELPDMPLVKKVHAAISENGGALCMQHVPIRSIVRWEKIFAKRGNEYGYHAMQLARACSSLCSHPILKKELRWVGLRHLIRKKIVQTIPLVTLLRRHRVGSIGVLALDCEGYDCVILRGLLRACESRPQWYPRWIILETNGMNDDVFGPGVEDETVSAFKARGYTVNYGGGHRSTGGIRDTVLFRKRCNTT